jgi:hypothetical protein
MQVSKSNHKFLYRGESRTQANNLLDMDDIVSGDRSEVLEEGCSETQNAVGSASSKSPNLGIHKSTSRKEERRIKSASCAQS